MPPTPSATTLDNGRVAVSFDVQGRIVELKNAAANTDLLTFPGLEDNWRIMVLTDAYPVVYILGREQVPESMTHQDDAVTYHYRGLVSAGQSYNIDVDFMAWLAGDELRFDLAVTNGHSTRIREVWCPILGGFQGFAIDGVHKRVDLAKSGTLARDILHTGLPEPIYLFCVEGETAHYVYPGQQMQWIDLFCEREGLYIASDDKSLATTVIRLEKYPPEAGATGDSHIPERHVFPLDTPRWMTLLVGKLTAIDPGERWRSAPAVFWPHLGDWHAAADHYRAWALSWMIQPQRPSWLANYVGWQHIVGKTYLNEVYHTFDQLAAIMKESHARTGVDALMIYGHGEHGCESADIDLSPATDLGGTEGFRRLCSESHRDGTKVMILTHRQSAIALDRPEYPHFDRWTIKDRDGRPRTEIWWKTTIESMMSAVLTHYEATGPIWARICPFCDEWWEGFRDQLVRLMTLGLDGAQLDTIGAEGSLCFATDHGHRPGEGQLPKLAERLAWLRREIHVVNPQFLLCGEELRDWQFQYLDLPYSRYRNAEGYQVFRYTFPELKENVAVAAYSYDQVNKSFMLGMGMDIEVWGLKKSVLVCPELADYIGAVVKIRRAYPEYLMSGRFRDTLGVAVTGQVRFGVHDGPDGHAVVLWNESEVQQECTVEAGRPGRGILCDPGAAPVRIDLPARLTVEPHRALAIIASERPIGAAIQ